MSNGFTEDTDQDLESQKIAYNGFSGGAFFVLIPIAGFFLFVWSPLGKGLLFVAVFTLLWSVPLSYFASKEIEKRKADDTTRT